jgi:hypothetical protein
MNHLREAIEDFHATDKKAILITQLTSDIEDVESLQRDGYYKDNDEEFVKDYKRLMKKLIKLKS